LESLRHNKPLVEALGNRSLQYLVAKRLFDIVGAVLLILMFSPIMLAAFITLAITTKGRPLFFQERIGHLGRRFRMIKFHTMRLDAANSQHAVVNEKDGPIFKNRRDPRITRLDASSQNQHR